MFEPNEQQRELIESTDGTYLVDAGAGTGKTFAVTRRYANIVEQPDIEPDDVLLVTFTNNAATEMKERIVGQSQYGMRELADAPIQTFHSLCHDLLQEHGHTAPAHLGIDDTITGPTRIVDDDVVEDGLFQEFINGFSDDNPEYDDVFRAISDPVGLLGLVEELAAKGVFPTADGWYRDGERYLEGDFDAFKRLFDDLNEPRNGGSKQSRLRSKLYSYGKNKNYLPDAPDKTEIRGSGKQIPAVVATAAFEEDRSGLKEFVHDVYHEYLKFALRRNYLNFGFLQLFAFVLLCENHDLRDEAAFEFVMVDEFQDSSEIQFKLALLLAGTDNVCVVGDWKQSIYGFQYADVDNIVEFEARLNSFTEQLNRDSDRVRFETNDVTTIEFVENYRSTQSILDFSEHGLLVPATRNDEVDVHETRNRIVSLESNSDHENTTIEAIQSESEHEAILAKVQDIVGNGDFQVEGDEGDLRLPEYRDIAVLTRTRDFGRELLQAADEYGITTAYEGGIELFRTDQAKLLLAWLRILEDDLDRGWAVVLEEAEYTLDEVERVLDQGEYPEDMTTFREDLASMETLGGVARRVFTQYGYNGETADVILYTIQSIHSTSTMTRGDLIRFIERSIDAGSTHEVSSSAGANSVTVQTIHSAKGLEYPIVILANMNNDRFPPSGGGSSSISYEDPIGLRQRTVYTEEAHGQPHIYDNWRSDVLRQCLPRDYDEERRLLYVAITRAESHIVFTADDNPNSFLEELPVDIDSVVPDPEEVTVVESEQTQLEINIRDPEGPVRYSPHSLMDDEVFEAGEEGRGLEFGSRVHEFAERYALGEAVEPESEDEEHIQTLLDSMDGELRVEESVYLPLEVDGERVSVHGIVDLVHMTEDAIEIIDYKTDRERHAEAAYRTQLSVYWHVLEKTYPDREIIASIFYTADDEQVGVEPLSRTELDELVRDQLGGE